MDSEASLGLGFIFRPQGYSGDARTEMCIIRFVLQRAFWQQRDMIDRRGDRLESGRRTVPEEMVTAGVGTFSGKACPDFMNM